jgi:hypothetical protein
MLLTRLFEPGLGNTVFDFGGVCLGKPYEPTRLTRFLRDASVCDAGTDPIEAVIQNWMLRCQLSPADVDVLRKTVAGETCAWIAYSRGTEISPNWPAWCVSVASRPSTQGRFGKAH